MPNFLILFSLFVLYFVADSQTAIPRSKSMIQGCPPEVCGVDDPSSPKKKKNNFWEYLGKFKKN